MESWAARTEIRRLTGGQLGGRRLQSFERGLDGAGNTSQVIAQAFWDDLDALLDDPVDDAIDDCGTTGDPSSLAALSSRSSSPMRRCNTTGFFASATSTMPRRRSRSASMSTGDNTVGSRRRRPGFGVAIESNVSEGNTATRRNSCSHDGDQNHASPGGSAAIELISSSRSSRVPCAATQSSTALRSWGPTSR